MTLHERGKDLPIGEHVVLEVRRHWLVPVGEILVSAPLMLVVLAAVLAAAVHIDPTSGILPLGTGFTVAVLWIAIPMLRWSSASLTVTDQGVILTKGVLGRARTVISFDAIQAIGTRQSILGRVLGYGTISIGTAVYPVPVSFERVPLEDVLDRLLAGVVAGGRGGRGGAFGRASTAGGPSDGRLRSERQRPRAAAASSAAGTIAAHVGKRSHAPQPTAQCRPAGDSLHFRNPGPSDKLAGAANLQAGDSMRLLISGGASGGHVSAALAVAEAFRARHPDGDILLVGRDGGVEEQMVPSAEFRLETIRVRGLDRDARGRNAVLPLVLPRALTRGLHTLDRFQPHVVLGVGAHAMVPCLWAALRRGVPYVLQVSEPGGLANQMLRRGAAAACVSFPADVDRFPTRRTVCTGYPVRRTFARRTPCLPPRRLLVMGGSLGARRLNRVVWQALDHLLQRFGEVVHLTGVRDAGEAAGHVRAGYRPIPATPSVADLMAEVDLVVCRAGLGTCAELAAVGLPAVLVPGLFGGAHQERNAAELVRAGAAVRIGDADLTASRLLHELAGLTPDRLADMARASAAMGHPDAADRIIDVLGETATAAVPTRVGRFGAAVSAAAGALDVLWGRSASVLGDKGGVQQLLGESEVPELLPHLPVDQRAEVVGEVKGVAGRLGRSGVIAAPKGELSLDHGEPGEVVPVQIAAADLPGLRDQRVQVPA
ncbi:MAG TPA: glycosyltransferase [Candidatus Eisenbacteria bacterium]|nr:glycosyltransferase [Candidatus Eisenbacteria bacterium]